MTRQLIVAAQAVLRAAEGAILPGPVYLSIAEVNALRAAVAAAQQSRRPGRAATTPDELIERWR